MYNVAHAFISVGASESSTWVNGVEPYVFKFQGGLRHLSGSLLLVEGMLVVYSQLHIINT